MQNRKPAWGSLMSKCKRSAFNGRSKMRKAVFVQLSENYTKPKALFENQAADGCHDGQGKGGH